MTQASALLSAVGEGPSLSPAAATHLLTRPLGSFLAVGLSISTPAMQGATSPTPSSEDPQLFALETCTTAVQTGARPDAPQMPWEGPQGCQSL